MLFDSIMPLALSGEYVLSKFRKNGKKSTTVK